MISNITLRRGGNDTSFNIYKQPLTIDVSLDFNYLVKGFAAYTYESKSNSDENLFGTAEDYEYIQRENGDTALPTLGHIVKSLRPKFPDISTEPYSNMKAANVFKPVKSKFTTSLISPISTISSTNNEVKNEMKNVYSDLLDISEEIDLTYV
jgi:hypothetical protein